MYKVLNEIRNLLKNNLNTSNTAESGTNTTNIKVTNHGLITGDVIVNVTRGNASRKITVVDANNFTVEAVTGQTSGDSITFYKFKKYYVGKYENPPLNHLPILCIYAETTNLTEKLTTATDSYEYSIIIEVLISSFEHVNQAEDNEDLQAQKELYQLIEETDSNGTPIATSVLGVLRRNIRGSYFLFNNKINIRYDDFKIDNKLFFKATLKLSATTTHVPRS